MRKRMFVIVSVILLSVLFLPLLLFQLGVFPFACEAVAVPDDLMLLDDARLVVIRDDPEGGDLRGLSFITSNTTQQVHTAYLTALSRLGWREIDARDAFGSSDFEPTLVLKKIDKADPSGSEEGAIVYIKARFLWVGLTKVDFQIVYYGLNP